MDNHRTDAVRYLWETIHDPDKLYREFRRREDERTIEQFYLNGMPGRLVRYGTLGPVRVDESYTGPLDDTIYCYDQEPQP